MLLIETFYYVISVIFSISLGLFVFLREPREKINRAFFGAVFCASGWLVSLYLYYTMNNPEFIVWIGRFNFAIILPMLFYLFEFTLLFPRLHSDLLFLLRAEVFIRIWVFIFSFITLFTSLVAQQELVINVTQRETIYGPLYFFYIFHYVVFSALILAILLFKIRKTQIHIERLQLIYVFLGLLIALVFGFVTNIVLYSVGIIEAAEYGPLAVIFFILFTAYAILKYHLFDIKVIATEIFTGLLLFLLILDIPNYSSIPQLVLNIGILAGSSVVGIFLIRSVLWEVKTRQEMEMLVQELGQANEELKKLDKAKSEFVSIASHQLRTPLTAIKGYISMLLEGTYGAITEKQHKPVQNVYDSNERLIKLVNDLLNVSRIDAGRIELKLEKKDLANIMESAVAEIKVKTLKTGTKLVYKKPAKSLPLLRVDEEKIRNVFLNVLDNAVRYTPAGTVTAALAYHPEQNIIRSEIKDTGEGMTKEELDRLFSSFTRGVAGARLWTEGAGLGLYIAKKFVELHKGKIWAESGGKGRGSVFVVELPLP